MWGDIDTGRISGTVIVIGASDRGKSTLVRWLVERLCQNHERVGWLDGDIGQATLGVPSTMNLAVINNAPTQLPRPHATFFVGSTSPKGHMLPTLVGVQRLRERALADGATAVVVDTTGMVTEEAGGRALKHWKIELLRPATVIALQRGYELKHILAPLKRDRRLTLHIFPPAKAVRTRSTEQRASRRSLLFRHYFRSAIKQAVRYTGLAVYGLERADRRSLVAFQDGEGFALALGVVLSIRREVLEVLTPLSDMTKVASLRLGALRINPVTGEEVGLSR